jgi:hypothetical protein
MGGLGRFIGAMLGTVMHWRDTARAEFPGGRERVVKVGLPPNIGGLNIYMNREQIEYLGDLGWEAAKLLLKRYALPDEAGGTARGWSEHRWLRLNLLCDSLRASVEGLGAAERAPYAQRFSALIAAATELAPLHGSENQPLLPAEAAALQNLLAALLAFESAIGGVPVEGRFLHDPQPLLRVQPPH